MNVFIVPSWYPSPGDELSGIFIKEQIKAIACNASNICQFVSTWGHHSGHISLRSPKQSLAAIQWRLNTKGATVIDCGNGIQEFFSPTFSWSNSLPFGGSTSILKANRRNLTAAIKIHGKIDIIHAHVGYPGGVIASILSKEFNIPYVITEHMGPSRLTSLMKKGVPIPELIECYDHAATVIAVSPFLKEKLRELSLGSPIVIPNLVDENFFYPGKSFQGKFIFFTLCILGKDKGIDTLLYSIANWHISDNSIEFWIAGDGPMAESYMALATHLGITNRIKWLGSVDRQEAAQLFRQCHAFVLPSRYETFGVVYAEAIATGRPVIATRCGGPEFIVNDANGILVNCDDPLGLMQAMQNMVATWDFYSPIAIRNDFLRRFSSKVIAEQLINTYRTVIRRA